MKKEFFTREAQKLLLFIRGFNIWMYITSKSSCTFWVSSEIIQLSC